jgi:protein MpaA
VRVRRHFIGFAVAAALLLVFSGSCSRRAEQKAVKQRLAQMTPAERAEVEAWCKSIDEAHVSLGWETYPCPVDHLRIGGQSLEGRPLVYWEFGKPDSGNTTLIFSMVHGDEVTPMYLGSRLHSWFEQHKDVFKDAHVVVAPLVNPDGFFRKSRTRVNARGVDLNRNLPTKDWEEKAIARWKKYGSNPRRFPGKMPNSEPETAFQITLIERYRPQKILSIHAPLNHLDYDGPNTLTLDRFPRDYIESCLELKTALRAKSTGFYAGSLGNFAGVERGIPTITLELPSANPKMAKKYWEIFEGGIRKMILFRENLVVGNGT